MKKVLLIFTFIYITLLSYGQKGRYSIKVCPFTLIDDISFPTVQGGLEYLVSNRFSMYGELGVKYRKGLSENWVDSNYINSGGYKAKIEARYSLNRGKSLAEYGRFYIGANAFLTHETYNTSIWFYPQKDSSFSVKDIFGVNKTIYGINAVLGWQIPVTHGFNIDVYGGLGVRFRYVTTVNKEFNYDTDSLSQSFEFGVRSIKDYVDSRAGSSCVPNFTMGCRLSFRL